MWLSTFVAHSEIRQLHASCPRSLNSIYRYPLTFVRRVSRAGRKSHLIASGLISVPRKGARRKRVLPYVGAAPPDARSTEQSFTESNVVGVLL